MSEHQAKQTLPGKVKAYCHECGHPSNDKHRIGGLNGWWSILFRGVLTLVAMLLPFMVAFGVWQVKEIYSLKIEVAKFISQGPRYTPAMAAADQAKLQIRILELVRAGWPPAEFREEVNENTRRSTRNDTRISILEARAD